MSNVGSTRLAGKGLQIPVALGPARSLPPEPAPAFAGFEYDFAVNRLPPTPAPPGLTAYAATIRVERCLKPCSNSRQGLAPRRRAQARLLHPA